MDVGFGRNYLDWRNVSSLVNKAMPLFNNTSSRYRRPNPKLHDLAVLVQLYAVVLYSIERSLAKEDIKP